MIEHSQILTKQEIYALYGLPQLDDDQKFLFFEMTELEIETMNQFGTYSS